MLVAVGQLLDGLELAEQLAVGDAGLCGFVAGPFEQIVAGGVQRVGEALEGIAAGAGRAALEPADVGIVEARLLAELGLGQGYGLR
ncbi:hypothetical protein IP83_10540 [Novosphingobium sp. AAP93]|nr:hypothetical protein [Novosphingobium sp. AAP93]KPF83412.1 hypothetical protein IP83_10540 [Novosphingobium sp. AAP93]